MQYATVGKYMMLGPFILTTVTILVVEPLTQVWFGLLSLVFFLFGIGLVLTSFGESIRRQEQNNAVLFARLMRIEGQLKALQ